MRRAAGAVILLAACRCGGGPAAPDDAAVDARPVPDAAVERTDAMSPYKPAPYLVWERTVEQGFVYVEAVHRTASGVFVVADPELVAYDSDGTETAREPWPDGYGGALSVAVDEGESDVVAVLFGNEPDLLLRDFHADGSRGPPFVDQRAWSGLALGAIADRRYLLIVNNATPAVDLLTIEAGALVASARLADGTEYWPHYRMVPTPSGHLLACATRWEGASQVLEVLRIDPAAGALATYVVAGGGDSPLNCWIERVGGEVLLQWAEEGSGGAVSYWMAILEPEGSAVQDGPAQVYTTSEPFFGWPGFAGDGEHIVGIAVNQIADVALLYPFRRSDFALQQLCMLDTVREFDIGGAGIAADPPYLYVAVTPTTGAGRDLILQKLWPLP